MELYNNITKFEKVHYVFLSAYSNPRNMYSMLPSFRTGPVSVQKKRNSIIFVGRLSLLQAKNSKKYTNISATNCWFGKLFDEETDQHGQVMSS